MAETRAMLSLFVAAALLYGSNSVRARARLGLLEQPVWIWGARFFACALVVHMFSSWRVLESATAAMLVSAVGLAAMSTAVTLVAPLWPRAFWGVVAISALAIPMLSLTWGGR